MDRVAARPGPTTLETNLTIQGNQLNAITKKVTSWAAIIAVPPAITGFYGQNVPYPGYSRLSRFVWSSTLILVLSLIPYVAFSARTGCRRATIRRSRDSAGFATTPLGSSIQSLDPRSAPPSFVTGSG